MRAGGAHACVGSPPPVSRRSYGDALAAASKNLKIKTCAGTPAHICGRIFCAACPLGFGIVAATLYRIPGWAGFRRLSLWLIIIANIKVAKIQHVFPPDEFT